MFGVVGEGALSFAEGDRDGTLGGAFLRGESCCSVPMSMRRREGGFRVEERERRQGGFRRGEGFVAGCGDIACVVVIVRVFVGCVVAVCEGGIILEGVLRGGCGGGKLSFEVGVDIGRGGYRDSIGLFVVVPWRIRGGPDGFGGGAGMRRRGRRDRGSGCCGRRGSECGRSGGGRVEGAGRRGSEHGTQGLCGFDAADVVNGGIVFTEQVIVKGGEVFLFEDELVLSEEIFEGGVNFAVGVR